MYQALGVNGAETHSAWKKCFLANLIVIKMTFIYNIAWKR